MLARRRIVAAILLAVTGCSLVVDVPTVMEGRRPEDERRKQIEIVAPVADDHADVPVAIIIADGDPDLVGRANPRNLAFFDDDGALLPHELATLDVDTGALFAWVRVPVIRADRPTVIYLHYGGPDREPFDSGEVWPEAYAAVWHLDAPGMAQRDSTAAHWMAEVTGPRPPDGDGGSLTFSGAEALELEDPPGGELDFGSDSFSYSAWVQLDTDPVESMFALRKGGVPETSAGYALHLHPVAWEAAVSDGTMQRELGFGNVVGPRTMLTVIVDRDPPAGEPSVCAYTNGETSGHSSVAGVGSVSTDRNLVMGRDFVGQLDEVRILSIALPEDRLLFEYRNIAAPESVLRFGGEQEP